jgi:hypothetical protein
LNPCCLIAACGSTDPIFKRCMIRVLSKLRLRLSLLALNKCPVVEAVVFAVMLASAFKGSAQTAQYVTLNCRNHPAGVQYQVQTNQLVSVVGYYWDHPPAVYGHLADGTILSLNPPGVSPGGSPYLSSLLPQIVTGLTNVVAKAGAYPGGWATFQITTPAGATVISNDAATSAIVIPASATGNVKIILESSTDLVNWTPARPGTYPAASAKNRYFRVRSVHN